MTDLSLLVEAAAYICAIWSFFVFIVQSIGISRIFASCSYRPRPPVTPSLPKDQVPHVTIIRPVKGLEPELYHCLASTFHLDYPLDKLTVYLCVSEKTDPAYPVLLKLAQDYRQFDVRVFVEHDDPLLHGSAGHVDNLGPNPKIRNVSRAYREAKGDIIWMIDCNIWVGKGTAGRMVDKLLGLRHDGKQGQPYKFVHMLPLVVDTVSLWGSPSPQSENETLLSSSSPTSEGGLPTYLSRNDNTLLARIRNHGGGRLDEMFMATTHAKFYSAINTVGIAPCIVGKSNMFRKSHLDTLTDPAQNPSLPAHKTPHPTGIDYFSNYICEDHLIGDLLFRSKLPGLKNHGLVFGDLAVQPTAGMSVASYIGRRVRWLRARKWTVITATLVEPGVESLLCCAYCAFALTTIPWFHERWGVPQTWAAMGWIWLATVALWVMGDWFTYRRLHAGHSTEVDERTPGFARGTSNRGGAPGRSFFLEWIPAWVGREVLALPIWTWAVLLGATVNWRGNKFLVRMDMSVVEYDKPRTQKLSAVRSGVPSPNGGVRSRSNNRQD
ncbi:ceramide glucosyltransferase [Sodiomyces alkalinus F11]|uniref:Ceramide glucosyltransferase n=1 Tax=Sodiomyces alkalinus (strain CBS 110278 / VKM F-3762 / F11) TaxID=1314773 RepID=A0A3N2PWW7_SODAK|nr:ceramide glucosyltransferase [Sodiomyces alkalinus F11]ROT39019.1 ceramide glucosyltransferase [Sodiomyces alkalinus F11]